METCEENSAIVSLKRQRAPLSDSEDNVSSQSKVKDGQKRRRMEAAGQENRSPKSLSSGKRAELEIKPETPIIPSVQFRVQQFTQSRAEGAPQAQRCLSDPGVDSPSLIIHENGFKEQLLGAGEFHQRMERFNVPVFQASPAPTPSPAKSCPRTCSNFVSGIQQRLQGTITPSLKQASRIRQEREQELSQLHFQPISENAWMRRSSSDPTLTQADGHAELKDHSFCEAPTSDAEKQSSDGTGEMAPSDSEALAASVELENSNEGALHIGWLEQHTSQGEDISEENAHKKEKQLGSPQLQNQSFSTAAFGDNRHVSELAIGGEQSLPELTHPQSNTTEMFEDSELGTCEVFPVEEAEETDGSSYSVEVIEPSTDEELRLWRYPQDKVCDEKSVTGEEQEENVCAEEKEMELETLRVDKKNQGRVSDCSEPSDMQESEYYVDSVSAKMYKYTELKPEEGEVEVERCLDDLVKDQPSLIKNQQDMESCAECYNEAVSGDVDILTHLDQTETEGCTHEDGLHQESKEIETVNRKHCMDRDSNSAVNQTGAFTTAGLVLKEESERNTDDIGKPKVETEAEGSDGAQILTKVQSSSQLLETEEMDQEALNKWQGIEDVLTEEAHKAVGGESSKKVTFYLKPVLIRVSSPSKTKASIVAETSILDAELISHDETNTAEIIDQIFEEVLEYAGKKEEERDEDIDDRDSGIGACSRYKDKIDTKSEKEKSEEEGETKDEKWDENEKLENNERDELTFPPSGILSPLSKSVEAVVTPLRLVVSQKSNPPSLLLTPEETTTPPAESAPLYSIDAYRTQRQCKPSTIQSITSGVQRQGPEKSQLQPSVNIKEKIMNLNEEAGKLQTVINQTLQALSCCTDEEHGRGSLEEAEAEKLLLVSCEKRSALLAEVTRLREERNSESLDTAGEDNEEYVFQQPCRGTVSITDIRLPLKVEFVCSSHNRTGRPSHYFFVLIRYGPCNIVATPLATAADAQNGDTISFPTSVTLKDIRSSFEIDMEVYSLSHTSSSNCSMDRTTTKSRVTPRKLLNTITQRSSNSLTSAAPPALSTRRSSNFCLVGSHKITLASLGHSRFPLDKMKLEGKIRRLLGDEFQEKVPFLSPLEGSIYLRLESESHSNVQYQGFLTMFELISGYGVWHRCYFVLEGSNMHYWNHPNDRETKEAEGSISLSSSPSQCVRPVKRDLCARPFTFELVNSVPQTQQDDSQVVLAKCWFSADTRQERLDWMEKLSQALLDFHTWNRTSATQTESHQSNTSSSGNLRESIL